MVTVRKLRASAMLTSLLAVCTVTAHLSAQSAPAKPRPLAALAARRVLVLPTHYLQSGDTLGWAAEITNPRDYLDELDAEIAFALGERGVKNRWVFPPALVSMAKRNPTYAPDPYGMSAQWLRPPMKRPPEQLPEPFASQIRMLIALQEDAQYVLFPVELHFEPVAAPKNGAAAAASASNAVRERAILRLVLLDARRSRITWIGDIASDPSTSFSRAIAASVADHIADLIGDQ